MYVIDKDACIGCRHVPSHAPPEARAQGEAVPRRDPRGGREGLPHDVRLRQHIHGADPRVPIGDGVLAEVLGQDGAPRRARAASAAQCKERSVPAAVVPADGGRDEHLRHGRFSRRGRTHRISTRKGSGQHQLSAATYNALLRHRQLNRYQYFYGGSI